MYKIYNTCNKMYKLIIYVIHDWIKIDGIVSASTENGLTVNIWFFSLYCWGF